MNVYNAKEFVPDFFSREEVEKILTCSRKFPTAYFLLKLLWVTGGRISEVLRICPRDINPNSHEIKFHSSRRKGHIRLVPISVKFLRELRKYILNSGIKDNERIFSFTERTAYNYVKKAVTDANLCDQRSHPSSFRHSFIFHCLASGVSIDKVHQLIGNRDMGKTVKYLKLIKSKNDITDIFE